MKMTKSILCLGLVMLALLSIASSRLSSNFLNGSILNFDSSENGGHWAVLVAGSNGFWNYRHQSDIFHAYHILVDNGVPKDQIIVFAYDDIANDQENPIKGKVFNKPDPKGPGKDVYAGVKIDYKGGDVTPENFLNVLNGKEMSVGSKRTLKSTSADRVFIYFSDHGATGLIAFPNGELYANDLNKTLKSMHDNKQYKELVFYLEACESGSMFNKILPPDTLVYTTTAANPDQSSWATYCSPDDVVNGVSIGSCLGDEYSVNWLEDSEANKGLTESLQIQYEHVRDKTKNSEVHQYGDLSYLKNPIGDYQGNQGDSKKVDDSFVQKIKKIVEKFVKDLIKKIRDIFHHGKSQEETKQTQTAETESYLKYLEEAKNSRVDSRDAKLRYLYEKAEKKNDMPSMNEYLTELKYMQKVDSTFKSFNEEMKIQSTETVKEINFECLKLSVEAYKQICQWGEYDFKFVRNIAIACETKSVEEISQAFVKVCHQ
jgi:legumain